MKWIDGMERPESVPNTLALINTAGNAYRLEGWGSLTIKDGHGHFIGITADTTGLDVAVYHGDGTPHYGLISVSYDTKDTKETS